MSESERFIAVQEWTINDQKSTTVYFNSKGEKIGQTFDGTFLNNRVNNIVSSDSVFKTDLYSYTQFADDAKMAEVFGTDTYNNFTEVEKLQAKQSEYWMRQLPDDSNGIWLNVTDDMPHSDNVVKASVEVILKNDSIEHINGVSKQDLQFVLESGDAGSQSVVDILKVTAQDAADIPNTNSNWFVSSELLEQKPDTYTIYNCYDADGKFVGVEFTKAGIDIPLISQNADDLLRVDTAEFAGDFAKYADDARLVEVFGYDNYVNFSDWERTQAKQIEYLTRQVTNLEGAPVDNQILNSYLAGSGKTIDQLDDMDRIAIRVSESLVNDSPSVPKLLKAAKNYEKIAKVSSVVGNVVDIAGTAFFIGKSIYDTQAAYDAGNEYEVAGIVAGAATKGKSDLMKVA